MHRLFVTFPFLVLLSQTWAATPADDSMLSFNAVFLNYTNGAAYFNDFRDSAALTNFWKAAETMVRCARGVCSSVPLHHHPPLSITRLIFG
jgi:hypothetical protein